MKKYLFTIFLLLFAVMYAQGQKMIEIKKFEFSMKEPENWKVLEKSELVKSLESYDFTDEELAKLIKNNNGSILSLIYMKHDPNLISGLNPKIQIDIKKQNAKTFDQFKLSLTNSAESLKKYFNDLEFIKTPQEIEVANIKSVYFVCKFSLKTQTGEELKVRSKVFAIPYKDYFFQVNFVDGQETEDNSQLFEELLKSIKIGK